MVLTRSMTAKLINYNLEKNRYDPNKRISLVNKENLKNHQISIGEMFDIYNDVKYKANKNYGIVEDNDLRPLLYAILGIFRNHVSSTILKIYKILNECASRNDKTLLLNLLEKLDNIDICMRQFSVNCGFGDLDINNHVIKSFNDSEIDDLFNRQITADNIKYMKLFDAVKEDYDLYINTIRNLVTSNSKFEKYFTTELCVNNFLPDSVYSYLQSVIVHLNNDI